MEITVIIPSYNCHGHLEKAIKSVMGQSFKNWQLIVFDDGSTDNSLQLIETLAKNNSKIKLLRHPGGINKGLPETLKKALSCVKTKYTAFLECDDYWHQDYLKEKAAVLQANPEVKIIYNNVSLFGTLARVKKLNLYYKAVNLYMRLLNPGRQNYNLNFALFLFNPVATFSCVLLETALLEHANFTPPFSPWLDRWLWAQLSFKNRFYYLNKKLTNWQLRAGSFTMQTVKEINKNQIPFDNALDSLYAQNLPAGKYYTVKYISQILDLLFNLIIFPFKIIYGAFSAAEGK